MTYSRKLRPIAAPFVVAPPAGARIRTRILFSNSEQAALTRIGDFLGGLARTDLAFRLSLGQVKGRDDLRAERKQALTALTSSRWAGAITRSSDDQYALGMRGLQAERDMLLAATSTISRRSVIPVGTCDVPSRAKGYRDEAERFTKTRRLAILRQRLVVVEQRLAGGRPRMTIGGNRLWRGRNHLEQSGLSQAQWRQRWDGSRRFCTADGESGKRFGNETIRLSPKGQLSIKIPAALVAELGGGTPLTITAPVSFSYRHGEWLDRVSGNQAIRYDIWFDPGKDRWYLDASWKVGQLEHIPTVAALCSARHLGVDLNADHLAASVIDGSGNPVGAPITIRLDLCGLPASTRDARVREAISELIRIAASMNCKVVTIENLGFVDARNMGRETMGRGRRGKAFRRVVASIPTSRFKDRLAAMCFHAGLWVIAVDPAYTSRWGGQHWRIPLQQQSSTEVSRHHGAAAAIGRRGHGHKIRRRKPGPRNRGALRAIPNPDPIRQP